jgi:Putative beta-barrel porin-2, OmpL-like. bbp2
LIRFTVFALGCWRIPKIRIAGAGIIMTRLGWVGSALLVSSGLASIASARAADAATRSYVKAPVDCHAPEAPYRDYDCLGAYLGDDFLTRLVNYYRLEWGHDAAPADPKAPPSRRAGWGDAAPQTVPPYPFTEWPYGGATSIGVTRPNSVDGPLMIALGNTALGKAMNDAHVQVYGWVNSGGNISTNKVSPGGNWPAAYDYSPNTAQLDQAVVYVERLPDTVQTDHMDWGFRLSAMYGENYRYTTAYGIASYQLLGHNLTNGYDFPMVYGELYLPQFAEGLVLRVGRFISIPDIEAQLAPNNYMYTHSMTYTFDNYTNSGLQATLALSKNWFVQVGVAIGSDTAPWHWGETVPNPFPNPVYPGSTMLKDPGAKPSITGGIRWQSDSGYDNIYVVADAMNDGRWGYNNLQWTGVTWYHKFDEQWHFAWETYTLDQHNVLYAADPLGIIANGGYPFTVQNGVRFNAPNFAQCASPYVVTCTARVFTSLMYMNYRISGLDNLSFRGEFYNDMQGQRTGTKTRYVESGVGLQHWLSPQVELRPEVSYYRSLDANAFNGNFNAPIPIAPTRAYAVIGAMDLIWHF